VPTNFIMDTIIQSSSGCAKRSSTAGVSVSLVAREHDINANQVFAWRKLYKDGLLDIDSSQDGKLLPVVLAELPPGLAPPTVASETMAKPAGMIHLAVGNAQLRLEGLVDAATLALVLEHLLR
jgi:transposase